MKRNVRLVVGSSLASISFLLLLLFFIPSYHVFYWSTPWVFVTLSAVGAPFAVCGSFLFGYELLHGRKRRRLRLLIPGAIIALLSVLGWGFAIFIAVGIYSDTGYWGDSHYTYAGDWLILGFQVGLFFLAIVLGLIGGFLVGLGLPGKKMVEIDE
jgi:hypothetical protein